MNTELSKSDSYVISGPLEGKSRLIAKLTADSCDVNIKNFDVFKVLFNSIKIGYILLNISKQEWNFMIIMFDNNTRLSHSKYCMALLKKMFLEKSDKDAVLVTRGIRYLSEAARIGGFIRVDDPDNPEECYFVYGRGSSVSKYQDKLMQSYSDRKFKTFSELAKLDKRIVNFSENKRIKRDNSLLKLFLLSIVVLSGFLILC